MVYGDGRQRYTQVPRLTELPPMSTFITETEGSHRFIS